MTYSLIAANYAAAPQISIEDIRALKDDGFTTIIANRPDHEDPGQLTFEEIKMAAEELGLHAHYLPIGAAGVSREAIEELKSVLDAGEKVLGYCRGGPRVALIWILTQITMGTDVDEALDAVRQAGFPFDTQASQLKAFAAAENKDST